MMRFLFSSSLFLFLTLASCSHNELKKTERTIATSNAEYTTGKSICESEANYAAELSFNATSYLGGIRENFNLQNVEIPSLQNHLNLLSPSQGEYYLAWLLMNHQRKEIRELVYERFKRIEFQDISPDSYFKNEYSKKKNPKKRFGQQINTIDGTYDFAGIAPDLAPLVLDLEVQQLGVKIFAKKLCNQFSEAFPINTSNCAKALRMELYL
jgi:hypothetical protein